MCVCSEEQDLKHECFRLGHSSETLGPRQHCENDSLHREEQVRCSGAGSVLVDPAFGPVGLKLVIPHCGIGS